MRTHTHTYINVCVSGNLPSFHSFTHHNWFDNRTEALRVTFSSIKFRCLKGHSTRASIAPSTNHARTREQSE